MALLNQMKLPSAIGVELKLDSIELNEVHAFWLALAADTVAPADAAGLSTKDEDEDEDTAPETAVSIFRTLGS